MTIVSRFSVSTTARFQDGLRPSVLRRLGPVVAIAGPNGAGKTRLLSRIESSMMAWARAAAFLRVRGIASELLLQRPSIELAQTLDSLVADQSTRGRGSEVEPEEWSLLVRDKLVDVCDFETTVPIGDIWAPYKVPTRPVKMDAAGNATQADLIEAIRTLTHASRLSQVPRNTLRILDVAAKVADMPSENRYSDNRLDLASRFCRAQGLFDSLLKSRVELNQRGQLVFRGELLDEPGFSDGELRLIQAIALLLAPDAEDIPQVLIFDEPENHLHPEAVIQLVAAFRELAPAKQLWIATHSLPLLASLDADSLWLARDGEFVHAGSKGEEVLEGLLGGRSNIDRLSQFIGLPAQLAATRFTVECLAQPESVPLEKGDPQISQIAETISKLGDDRRLRILDWGAGKGRLAAGLAELENIDASVSYFAFDPFGASDECNEAIARLHGDERVRHFSEMAPLFDQLAADRPHLVVMCNVLHEIPPNEWLALFGPGQVGGILGDDGFLLIVEDLEIPHGELAYGDGFLLLDKSAAGLLLADPELAEMVAESSGDEKYAGRLVSYLIPARLLTRITPQTLSQAVRWTRDQARRKIDDLRAGAPGYRQGLDLARALQQFANASLFLERQGDAGPATR